MTCNLRRHGNAQRWINAGLRAAIDRYFQGAGWQRCQVHYQRNLLGNGKDGLRKEFFYWTDDGGLAGLRYDKWKLAFMEQRAHGFDVWQDPMVTLRVPKLFDLKADPFERGDHEGMGYNRWRIYRIFLLVPAQVFVNRYIQSLVEFPPRQRPGSFNLEGVLDKLMTPPQGVN